MVLRQFGITELDNIEGGSGNSIERNQRRLEYVKLFNDNEESDENQNVTFCLMNTLVEDNVCVFLFWVENWRELIQQIKNDREQAGKNTVNYAKPDCGLGPGFNLLWSTLPSIIYRRAAK